jgi:tRNA/rRNA methyltransferase
LETPKLEQVVHSSCEFPRSHIHAILVRPEYGGNVGSAARALANMGIQGTLRIVGTPAIRNDDAWRMAKHAKGRLENALFFSSLKDAIPTVPAPLLLAATARSGSANRPHPVRVDKAVERALDKLQQKEVSDLVFVFGPESDGLSNDEVRLCDWVVTIPSSEEYRSLNLAQSVLLFGYEVNRHLTQETSGFQSPTGRSQKDRLVAHIVGLAEATGFILPGDPYKMRPRLEEILSQLPPYLKDVNTVHGLLDQAIRSVKAGTPDIKGRFKHRVETQEDRKEQ